MESHVYEIYTDGSSKGNPGPSGLAWSIDGVVDSKPYWLHGENGERWSPPLTNNQAEMYAINEAVSRIPYGSRANVFTDSQVAIAWLTKKGNCPHWIFRDEMWRYAATRGIHIDLYLIKGKSNSLSRRVDKAARAAAKAAWHTAHENDEEPIPLIAFLMGIYPRGLR